LVNIDFAAIAAGVALLAIGYRETK